MGLALILWHELGMSSNCHFVAPSQIPAFSRDEIASTSLNPADSDDNHLHQPHKSAAFICPYMKPPVHINANGVFRLLSIQFPPPSQTQSCTLSASTLLQFVLTPPGAT
jgi:hypothetical protein